MSADPLSFPTDIGEKDLTLQDLAAYKITKLEGQNNFAKWERDLKMISEYLGIWGYYAGETLHVDEPDIAVYMASAYDSIQNTINPSSNGPTNATTSGTGNANDAMDSEEATPNPLPSTATAIDARSREHYATITVKVAEKRFDTALIQWKKQTKDRAKALTLLRLHVSTSIRSVLSTYTDPYEAFSYLTKQYRLSNHQYAQILHKEIESLKLKDCANLDDFFSKLQDLIVHLRDIDHQYDDSAMQAKIFRSLTPDFNDTVKVMNLLYNRKGHDWPPLDDVKRQLQEAEIEIAKSKKGGKPSTGSSISDNNNSGTTKQREKCKTPGCRGSGHPPEKCFVLHPELKPDWLKMREQTQAEKKNAEDKPATSRKIALSMIADHKEIESEIQKGLAAQTGRLNTACNLSSTLSNRSQISSFADSLLQASFNSGQKTAESESEEVGGVQKNEELVFRSTVYALISQLNQIKNSVSTNWILDSGANLHLCNNRSCFVEFTENVQRQIKLADSNAMLDTYGGGTAAFHAVSPQGKIFEIMLSNVIYAPDALCSLVSISQLAAKGVTGHFHDNVFTLRMENEDIIHAKISEGLYLIECSPVPVRPLYACPVQETTNDDPHVEESTSDEDAVFPFNHPVWKLHRDLGHMPLQSMKNVLDMSTGLNITKKQIESCFGQICPICETTKGTIQIPRDPASRRGKKPGDLIHLDIWGPYNVRAHDGTNSVLNALDDATRYQWTMPLKARTAFENVLALLELLRVSEDIQIRRIRLDNGLSSNALQEWCRKEGIGLERSAPHRHHQNGAVERANRTTRDRTAVILGDAMVDDRRPILKTIFAIIDGKTRESLQNTQLPKSLWVEAYKHAVYLKNRTPTRALKSKKTPFEALYELKPNLSSLRPWGARAFVTIPTEIRNTYHNEGSRIRKLDPRGWMGYFVGCESDAILRIWNPEKGKVVRTDTARILSGEVTNDPQIETEDSPSLDLQQPDTTNADLEWSDSGSSQEESASSNNRHTDVASESDTFSERDLNNSDLQLSENHLNNETQTSDSDSSDGDQPVTTTGIRSRFFLAKRELSDNDLTDYERQLKRRGALTSKWTTKIEKRVQKRETQEDKQMQKCRACFTGQKKCDGVYPFSTKCSWCVRKNSRCVPQGTYRPKKGSGLEADKKCYPCQRRNRTCTGVPPFKDACWNCETRGIDCFFREKGPPKPRGVSSDQKCASCLAARAACDGQTPCARCVRKEKKCVPQLLKNSKNKCNFCQHRKNICDQERPCNTCVKAGKTWCIYKEPNGKTSLKYATPMKIDRLKWEDNSNICRPCNAFNRSNFGRTRDCNGELPCNYCTVPNKRGYSGGVSEFSEERCSYDLDKGIRRSFSEKKHRRSQEQEVESPKTRPVRTQMTLLNNKPDNDDQLNVPADSISDSDSDPDFNPGPQSESDTDSDNAFDLDSSTDSNIDSDADEVGEGGSTGSSSPGNEELDSNPDEDENQTDVFSDSETKEESGNILMACLLTATGTNLGEPMTLREAKRDMSEWPQWADAMKSEYQSLTDNKTWILVPRSEAKSHHVLSSRWVLKRKLDASGNIKRYKARLVARGFQQIQGQDYNETFASVARMTSYRLLFYLAARYQWKVYQVDIVTAFLHGDLDEVIFLDCPEGYEKEGYVLKLQKAIYGLKQAPRQWYIKLTNFLLEQGWKVSDNDPSMFIHPQKQLLMLVFVDDIILCAKSVSVAKKWKKTLARQFPMTDEGECSYVLGFQVERCGSDLYVHQESYVNQLLLRHDLHDIPSTSIPYTISTLTNISRNDQQALPEFTKEYQSMVGELLYLSLITRPDITYPVGVLTRFCSNPSQEHMDCVIQIFRYVKGTPNLGLYYNSQSTSSLIGYSDSDWGTCRDTRRSVTGWITMLGDSIISFTSKRQKVVAQSTQESEYIAAADLSNELVWIQRILSEFLKTFSVQHEIGQTKTKILIDNNAALTLAKNPEHHRKAKHIEIRYHVLRQRVNEGSQEVDRIDSENNLADFFTKPLPRDRFEDLRHRIGMRSPPKTASNI